MVTLSKTRPVHGSLGLHRKHPGKPPGAVVATMSLKTRLCAVSHPGLAASDGGLHADRLASSVYTLT